MSDRARRIRILSVEDDTLNRALLRASLAATKDQRINQADLVEATTLADARRAIAAARYDLVLLDRRLPDGDGFQLAAELRAADPPRPWIVAITADAIPATRSAAMEAGCDAVVTKPYVPGDLVSLLVRQLESTLA